MKFPTSNGVGVVRGNQNVTRQCYVSNVQEIKTEGMQVSKLELEHCGRMVYVEELLDVELELER